jgi:rare lipoprotein A
MIAAVEGDGMTTGDGRLGLCRSALGVALAVACLSLTDCSPSAKFGGLDPRFGVASSERVVDLGAPVPKGGGVFRIGRPYQVAGRTYVPEEGPGYATEGLASWYGDDFHGRRTANGEVYDMEGLSAAHPTLPMPSYVRVTNLNNRRSIILRVNDRGPYHANRVVDVSKRAAHLLGFHGNGVARVRVEYVGPASLDGSDDHLLAATLREGEPAPAPSLVMLASSRPFVPQAAAHSPVVRGDVPMPPERPYTLGEDEAQARGGAFNDRFNGGSSNAAAPIRSSFVTR